MYLVEPCVCRAARHPEFRCLASHLRLVGDALVAGIGVDALLNTMQQAGRRCQIVNVRSGDHDRVDQS